MARDNYTVKNSEVNEVFNNQATSNKNQLQDNCQKTQAPQDNSDQKGKIMPKTSNSSTKQPAKEEVEIPILNNVIGSKYSFLGKSIWILILLTCACTMLSSIIQRIIYYNSDPVSTSLQIYNNDSMEYPDVSICKTSLWNQEVVSDYAKQVANGTGKLEYHVTTNDILIYFNITIMDYWLLMSYKLEDIIVKCTFEQYFLCEEIGEWRQLFTISGICYTYRMNVKANATGPELGLQLILNDSNTKQIRDGWKVLLHDKKSEPKTNIFTSGISVSPKTPMDMKFRMEEYHWKMTSANRCSNETLINCNSKCISDLILETYNCRLPFMDDTQVPFCSPQDTLERAEQTVANAFFGRESRCRLCLPQCDSIKYITIMNTKYHPKAATNTTLNIYYEHFNYISVIEDYSYDVTSLFSDIGGTLCFFMGMSFVTMAEIMASLFFTVRKTISNK